MDSGSIFRNIPPVVKNLLIINVLAFVATIVLQQQGTDFITWGALYYAGSPFFEPYQIVTHMFLHGGPGHLLMNMLGLVMIGSLLERIWGPKRFLFFYLMCGLGSAIVLQVYHGIVIYDIEGRLFFELNDSVYEATKEYIYSRTVGASGALYGTLVAFWRLFPNQALYLFFIPVPIKAKYFVPGLLVLDLYLGIQRFSGDNVAHFAHLGGALFGFFLVLYWQKKHNRFY